MSFTRLSHTRSRTAVRGAIILACACAIAVGCDGRGAPATVTSPLPQTTKPGVVETRPVRLDAILSAPLLPVGERVRLDVFVRDGAGALLGNRDATVDMDTSMLALDSIGTYAMTSNGVSYAQLRWVLRARRAGQTVVRVSVGGLTASAQFESLPIHAGGGSLAISSFRVIEYRDVCAWNCPYLIYAPLVELREVTGAAKASVSGIRVDIGEHTTGWCGGNTVDYRPGEQSHLIGFDPYPWANDILFASISGVPFPAEQAQVLLLVIDAQGTRSFLTATGPVERVVRRPDLPGLRPNTGWNCI